MTKTEYAEYIRSEPWQQRRKQAIADAGNMCGRCDLPRWVARLVYDQDLHVHHRNYQNLGNEQDDDLEVLCRRCHEIETFGRSDYREIKVSECSHCQLLNWNIYSDYCDKCRLVFSMDEPFFFNLDSKNQSGEPLWRELIFYGVVHGLVPVSDLLSLISNAEMQRKTSREKRKK